MGSKEQRNEPRWDLARHLTVIDSESGDLLGRIVNAGYKGMAIVGSRPLSLERKIAIAIEIPAGDETFEQLAAQVYSVWSKSLHEFGPYMSGLHIFLMPPACVQKYREAITRLRLPQPD